MTYFCKDCGAKYPKWVGKCNTCGSWETIVSEPTQKTTRNSPFSGQSSPVQNLAEINTQQGFSLIQSGVQEFDQVVGGGIVPASIGLLGGEPGIGKSTLILQLLSRFQTMGCQCFYVTGEESALQVKNRADRLEINQAGIQLFVEASLDKILAEIEQCQPTFIVIDSIQSLYSEQLDAASGTITQIRECTSVITRYAKSNNKAFLLIGHVNKEGTLAGPKVIEHLVDYVLTLEGATNQNYRYIRALKNRFGNLNETGFFRMTKKGLAEVKNPNLYFLERFAKGDSGSVIFPAYEGSRTMFSEIQALVSNYNENFSTRTSLGIERNRLLILLAVIEKHLHIALGTRSVYLNIAGGMSITDTSVDMAIIGAIYSSYKNIVATSPVAMMGEVSLSGEFTNTPYLEEKFHTLRQTGVEVVLYGYRGKRPPASGQGFFPIANVRDLVQNLDRIFAHRKAPKAKT